MTFYYDADCGICTALAGWAARNTRARPRAIAQSRAELIALGIPADALLSAAHVESNGAVCSGSRAIATILTAANFPPLRAAGYAANLPLLRTIAAFAYSAVARNRSRISRLLRR